MGLQSFLTDSLTKVLYRKFPRSREIEKKSDVYWNKIKSNEQLRKKLDKYSVIETFVMIISWMVILILMFRYLFDAFPIFSTNKLSLYTIVAGALIFVFMLSSMLMCGYLQGFLIRWLFNCFNPDLDSGLLKYYSFRMFDKEFIYSAQNMKANPNPVDNVLMKWGTIISIIVIILFILLIPRLK